MKNINVNQSEFIRVTLSENQLAYEAFAFDVKNTLQNRIQVKTDPHNHDLQS